MYYANVYRTTCTYGRVGNGKRIEMYRAELDPITIEKEYYTKTPFEN